MVRTLLDGTHPTVLLQSQLSNPNGIAVARDTVYVADSNYNNRTEMAEVFIYHTANNTGERLVIEEKVKVHCFKLFLLNYFMVILLTGFSKGFTIHWIHSFYHTFLMTQFDTNI